MDIPGLFRMVQLRERLFMEGEERTRSFASIMSEGPPKCDIVCVVGDVLGLDDVDDGDEVIERR